MTEIKMTQLRIEHFRGIPNELFLDFTMNKKPESILLYGDNGSGKSSIIDAIELVTQGSVQGSQSGKEGEWLYQSVSLSDERNAKVTLSLSDDSVNTYSLEKDSENLRIEKNGTIIQAFRYAPFILRRQDILNFWALPNQEKLKIFIKYVITRTPTLILTDTEELRLLADQRLLYKTKKRELLTKICSFYKLDFDEMTKKSKADFLAIIRPLNKGKGLGQLSPSHPQYDNLQELSKTYDELQGILKKSKKVSSGETPDKNKTARDMLQRMMVEISPEVTAAFKKISKTSDYVSGISILVAEQTEMSIQFVVKLGNGLEADPAKLFSEANRDLLALLIYFEFIRYSSEYGQAKVLVMDDIFQSVDSTIRFRVMQYIIDRFSGWQFIITTHDRLWKEQLVQLFRTRAIMLQQFEVVNWTFEDGPRIISGTNSYDEKLLRAMNNGTTADICSAAGYVLEYMCEKLSCLLSTSIRRKYGDKYTIGDLWPGVYKELRKSKGREVFQDLNDVLYLRNMVGSHYNEWSLSLSRSEAIDFANAVIDAYYHVCCRRCGRWIKTVDEIQEEELAITCKC